MERKNCEHAKIVGFRSHSRIRRVTYSMSFSRDRSADRQRKSHTKRQKPARSPHNSGAPNRVIAVNARYYTAVVLIEISDRIVHCSIVVGTWYSRSHVYQPEFSPFYTSIMTRVRWIAEVFNLKDLKVRAPIRRLQASKYSILLLFPRA